MEIIIKIKNVYGEDKVYPACPKAEVFATMLHQKTFTPEDLKNIRALGYEVVQALYSGDKIVTTITYNN